MKSAEIRPLRENDATVVQLWLSDYLGEHRAWWAAAYGREPESSLEELVRRDWDDLCEASGSVSSFVRAAGVSSPVGIVSARKQPDRFMGFEVGILSWIYVDPLARGRGVADALMEAAGVWMSGQGVEGRQVYVTIGNEAAVRLYQRHGYKAADYRMLAR
jgi:ribosomal protein S18 acetylase RimI-like enzyme